MTTIAAPASCHFTFTRYSSQGYTSRAVFESLSGNKRSLRELWSLADAIPVKRVVFHPMYDLNSYEYDAVVLELERPVLDRIPAVLELSNGKNLFERYI